MIFNKYYPFEINRMDEFNKEYLIRNSRVYSRGTVTLINRNIEKVFTFNVISRLIHVVNTLVHPFDVRSSTITPRIVVDNECNR